MIRRAFNRRHGRMEPGFNLIPMLDMVFYLLFFFIMATQMRDDTEQRMDVRLPSARSVKIQPVKATPSLTLSADGRMIYQNRPLGREELELVLHVLAGKGQHEIAIRGDKRVDYGRVVEVMDWCKLAGMKSVLLELGRPDAGAIPPRE